MPIGEKLTQGTPAFPPEYSKEWKAIGKKRKAYESSCKAQGVTPLDFDEWWKRGAPAVPALTKELPPSQKEIAKQQETRVDVLGNIIDPVGKTVQLATGEVVSMEQYINDTIQQLNEYNTVTPEELADPLAQKDISTLQEILKGAGVAPPEITAKSAKSEEKEMSPTGEDRAIIENQIRQEITSHPEKYKEWDAEDLIRMSIYYRLDSGYPASDNMSAISAATGQSAPIASKKTPEKTGTAEAEQPDSATSFGITEKGRSYRVFGTVDKSGKFTESNRILTDDTTKNTTPGNWYETGDLSQIKGIQSQEREPTEFDYLLQRGTPVWLKEFMSEKEYQQEQANTQAWQNYYSQVNAMDPTLFVGQMSPEELASGRDISGIGFNQQWAEDAYQGLIKNLGSQGTSKQNLPDKESFMKEAAGTGIMNTLNQIYNQRGWDTAMTQGTPLKNTAAQSPWWTRQWNLSAQDYNKLNPTERTSYDKYTQLSGSNWWNPTKGKLGSSGTGITPAYQRQ